MPADSRNPTRPDTLVQLAPGLRRVLAPNPSPMTYWGTNTFLVGDGALALIDPGPDDPAHLDAILSALRPGERISHILVTHSHRDHSALTARLKQATGAPVLAFGDSRAGRRDDIATLRGLGGGEGVDADFAPDRTLTDNAVVRGDGWALRALWTPGHMGNHLCFASETAVFCGDVVMGWSTSLVSPPDGDLGDFLASLTRLGALADRVFYPAHGDALSAPAQRLRDLAAHRQMRTDQILDALAQGAATAQDLTVRIYADIPQTMWPAARRNVLAHLIALKRQGRVDTPAPLTADSAFSLRPAPN